MSLLMAQVLVVLAALLVACVPSTDDASLSCDYLCKCDGSCELFRDCCADCDHNISQSVIASELQFACVSVHLPPSSSFMKANESFNSTQCSQYTEAIWVVSSCPALWNASPIREVLWIVGNCSNAPSSLPPVSSRATGWTYRNEYCAVCNGVEEVVPWSYRLSCSEELQVSLFQPDFVLTADELDEECSTCSFEAPDEVNTRLCQPSVSSCFAENATSERLVDYNQLVNLCMFGPYCLVTANAGDSTVFRNEYCAFCNGFNSEYILCFNRTGYDSDPPPAFEILLDSYRQVVSVSTETKALNVTCLSSEVFDPVVGNCRVTLYGMHTGLRGRHYVFDSEFNCSTGFIALNQSEYEYIDSYTILYSDELYTVRFRDVFGRPLICVNLSLNEPVDGNATQPIGYTVLSHVSCSLSVIGSVLLLITYAAFKELRNFPAKILINLSTAILLTSGFIVTSLIFTSISSVYCSILAIILHECYLTQFTWMTILVFEMCRALHQAAKLRPANSKTFLRKLLVAYMLMGWGIPPVIVVVTVAVNYTTDYVWYGVTGEGSTAWCWINHKESAAVVFSTPIGVLLLLSLGMFAYIVVLACRGYCAESKLEKTKNTPYFRLGVSVFLASGLSWLFAYIGLYQKSWAVYVFVIFNNTQGFLIFLAFLCTKRVFKLYLSRLPCKALNKFGAQSSTQN